MGLVKGLEALRGLQQPAIAAPDSTRAESYPRGAVSTDTAPALNAGQSREGVGKTYHGPVPLSSSDLLKVIFIGRTHKKLQGKGA